MLVFQPCYFWAMSFLPAEEKAGSKGQSRSLQTLIAGAVCVVSGALLVFAALDLPAFGDPNAPAQLHVAPRYLEESGTLLHIPNVVTTVLASYRGLYAWRDNCCLYSWVGRVDVAGGSNPHQMARCSPVCQKSTTAQFKATSKTRVKVHKGVAK